MNATMDAGPMDIFGAIFGIFGLLYFVFTLFMLVLSAVLMFKAIGFMKKKAASDDRLNQNIESLIQRLDQSKDDQKDITIEKNDQA